QSNDHGPANNEKQPSEYDFFCRSGSLQKSNHLLVAPNVKCEFNIINHLAPTTGPHEVGAIPITSPQCVKETAGCMPISGQLATSRETWLWCTLGKDPYQASLQRCRQSRQF